MPKVSIQKLSKSYKQENNTLPVLKKLDIDISPSSIISIEGASGSGKSTLLNILGTLEQANEGKILYGEKRLDLLNQKEKEHFRSKKLGFIFQNHYLLPDFSILENTMMPLLIARKSWKESKALSIHLLEYLGLKDRLQHYPSQISGGEMARVGVARALVGNKELLLADEPTGNLDQKNSDKLIQLLLKLQKEIGFSLVIVTHDQNLAKNAPIRYQLENGKLKRFDT